MPGWLHRNCAGIPRALFKDIVSTEVNNPFYCLHCTCVKHAEQISSLTSTIEVLAKKVADLQKPQPGQSFAEVVESQTTKNQAVTITGVTPLSNSQRPFNNSEVTDVNRKFNVIVYGIKECDSGTNRHNRLLNDTSETASMIATIDSNIPESSIQDCIRLGKYSEEKCRPILVKLSRTCEVSSLLSQRRKLKGSGLTVKADLNKKARKVDQLLMKLRWDLIQSGTDRDNIRIRGNSIYVNDLRKGSVNGVLS